MFKLVYGFLLALCGSVLIHIAIILLIPHFDKPEVTKQIELLSQSFDPLIIKESPSGFPVLGLDPFFNYRVCVYDLENGGFQLMSNGDVPFFSATLIAENGDVLFSITDRQTIARTLNIEVRPLAQQQRLSELSVDTSVVSGAVPVFVSETKGYAIVRAFVPDASWDEIVGQYLKDIVCQTIETAN